MGANESLPASSLPELTVGATRGEALPIFDAEAALERTAEDRDLLMEILGLFREQAEPTRDMIQAALMNRDGPALERAAHSLKGSASNISAEQVREATLQLEHAAP